jgi:nucleoid-associated protein YgaU
LPEPPAELQPHHEDRPLPKPAATSVVTEDNDSLWKISERVYGHGHFYKALFLHNQALVPRPDRLPPGIELATPSSETLQQLYPAECTSLPKQPAL